MADDWAWGAGLFEGEGCIRFQGRRTVSLYLAMTDEDVVRRFAALTGVGTVRTRRGREEHHKIAYAWVDSQADAVAYILIQMLPWLGERRAARARAALKRLGRPDILLVA